MSDMSETGKWFGRRGFIAGLAATSGAAILAACGGEEIAATATRAAVNPAGAATAATTAVSGAATAVATAAGGAAPTAASGAAPTVAGGAMMAAAKPATGTINYWHHFTSETEMKGMEKVINSFKTKNPGAMLVQENIPNASFMQKVTAGTQAKSLPDTLMVSADRVSDMVAMGAVKDLTERVTSTGLKAQFPDNRWTVGTVNGKIYGVPAFMFVNWYYYRPDYFAEAGITKVPTTWAEFADAAQKLSDPAKNRYGFGMRGGDGGEGFVTLIMRGFGSPIVDDKGKPAIDVAKATEALTLYTDIFTKRKAAPPSAPNDSYAQLMTAFKTGQTAMVLHHTGSLKEVRDALGDKFKTAVYPAGPAALISDVTPLYNGMSATIPNDKQDAAWSWITQWTDVNSEIDLLQETGYFPANPAAAMSTRLTGDPIYGSAIEALNKGTIQPQFVGQAGWLKQSVLPAFQKVLLGMSTPAQSVEEMVAGLKKATS